PSQHQMEKDRGQQILGRTASENFTYGKKGCIIRCAFINPIWVYYSTDFFYSMVAEYRFKLKEQVNNAISTGKLHRLVPQDRAQPMQF
ncbi:unnamed protein product, partial [Rotaria sp. Silwood2]